MGARCHPLPTSVPDPLSRVPLLSRHPGIFFQDQFYPAQVGTQYRAFEGLLKPVPVSHKPRRDRLWRMMSNGFELAATRPDAVRSGTSHRAHLRMQGGVRAVTTTDGSCIRALQTA